MQIIPSILTNNKTQAEKWLKQIKDSGKFDRVQVDFIDGEYTNNQTIFPTNLENTSSLKLDAHLMVVQSNLAKYVSSLVGFDRVIVQMESISNPEDFDCLALDIHSPIEAIKPYLSKLKLVNLMSIEPGFGGQEFIDKVFEKINVLRNQGFKIAVDGGAEKEYLDELEKAGVDEVVVGAARVLSW